MAVIIPYGMRGIYARRFLTKVDRSGKCWLWLEHKDYRGYGVMHVGNYPYKAHRVSYELFWEEIPEGMWVLHKCDVPACCNPEHLYLGTVVENSRDRKERGRAPSGDDHWTHRMPDRPARGEKSGVAKFSPDVVRVVRQRYAAGIGPRQIARDVGASRAWVQQVVKRQIWAHLED